MILPCALALFTTLAAASTTDQEPFFVPYRNATPPILSVSDDQWAALNSSVAGRLHSDLPFAKPCFSRLEDTDVVVDESACTAVRQNYSNESECPHDPCVTFLTSSTGRATVSAIFGPDQHSVGGVPGPRGVVSPRSLCPIRSSGHPPPAGMPLRERL